MACERINQKCITLNFSSQTKIEDLLGQMARNSDQFGGFSFKKGPYSEAYEKGYCLILDEINLAHETVLQSIEASLDLGFLSFDAPGVGTEFIRMNDHFHIIATQNPLTGRFSQKRQYLSEKFLSRFHVINFDDISKEELTEIAVGLSDDKIPKKIIQRIVNFHFDIQKQEKNEIHVFTIREIASTIQSILNGYTPYESIIYHYVSRYEKNKFVEIKKLIEKSKIKEDYSENHQLNATKYNNKLYYLSSELDNVFKCAWSILRDYHPILLVGPDGCGKTSIARWIGQLIPIQNDQLNQTRLFVCNQEMTISDIIGRYMPVKNTKFGDDQSPIRWINGPIIDAIQKGEILVLDQIDTAPSTILERLNSLYDGMGSPDFIFTVQENPEESEVLVHQSFRIIATASERGLNDLSPAFLNRFTIIHINDQIPEIMSSKEAAMKCGRFFAFQQNNLTLPRKLQDRLFEEGKNMTISRFAKIIRGFSIIKRQFKIADDNDIANFMFSITDQSVKKEDGTNTKAKYNEPIVSESFARILLDSLDERKVDEKNDAFYFKEASSTRKIMATLVACSLIGQHVIMIGKTGLGKTAAAMAFGRMIKHSKNYQMISFNGETQLEELFGFFTIEKGNFTLHNGPLSNAMINGQVFIADELNLAEQQIIQSLNVALEPFKNETITVPVVGSNVKVDPGFFFIGCQNDITMFGRRPLPESFKKKVLCLEYPESSHSDLFNLIVEISKQFNISQNDSQCTTSLIEKMKEHPVFKLKPWSLREVRKLFRRTYYSSRHQDIIYGIKIQHHAAFLIRSSFRSEDDVTKDVVDLVSESFKLKEHEKKTLLNDLESKVTVKFTDENKIMIKKGSLTLESVIHNSLNVPEELQSFWQLYFEANLAHFAEPLLLVGPSGFKTFLAKMLLPLSPPVYLHNDSTTSSLIGQIALLDKYQAKLFLLDSLRIFFGINPVVNLFNEVRSSLESDDLKKSDLDNLLNAIKDKAPESFGVVIDTIGNNIIALDKNEQSNSLFANYASIFKPGLITRAIFEQNSLILKNIAQPSPTVLERFNELLSVTPTLTLFEDTSNTFTPDDPSSKVLFNFSQRFRIIGICLPHEKHGLSDAMLSRLTEINVPSYTETEKSLVYSLLMKNDPKTVTFPFDSLMRTASEIFKSTFDIDLSFALSIQMAKLTTKWSIHYQSKDITKDVQSLFAFALFRCAGGYLLSTSEEKAELIEAMNKTVLKLPNEFTQLFIDTPEDNDKSTLNEPHLRITNGKAIDMIESTLTGFSADTINEKLPKSNNLLFTKSFSDLVDLVVSMSDILQPLLIEGESGCGKSSAVSYVADCVGANVIRISISQSTTIEDLFGKVEPSSTSDSLKFDFVETDLLHALRSDRDDAYITNWIIIEELHLASAAVLDALAAVFNPDSEQIWLPNGDYVNKGRYFIIGLLSKPISHQAIVNTTVYYKANDYSQEEFCKICTNILKNEDYEYVSNEFCEKIVKLSDLSSNSHMNVPITAREAYKFIKMMKASNNLLMPDQVMEMLFLGRFVDEESQATIKKEFFSDNQSPESKSKTASLVPYITVQNNATILNSGDAKIAIKENYSCHKNIKSLTVSQRQLFQFMTLAVNSNIPLIVQGQTSSGKTYIINLFANIVGQKLHVIQLNSETTSASIAGNYQPSSTLSDSEYQELHDYLKQIMKFNILPHEIRTRINQKKIRDWIPSEFREVRNLISKNMNKYETQVKLVCEQYIKIVDSSLQFFNHLIRKDSTIVQSLVEGDWLLLDGIESAPPDLFDRLFSLTDDKPTLNLYERGKGFIYSVDAKDQKFKINENFRLFMTYNPTNSKANSISPAFLSRCALFTLNPIDNNIIDSALAISGLIDSIRFELDENILAVAVRLAKAHKIAKKNVKDSSSTFFTGRTFVHLCRALRYEYSVNGLISNNALFNMMKKHYLSTLESNSNELYQDLIEPLSKSVNPKILKDINDIILVSSKHCIALSKIIENFSQSLTHSSNDFVEFPFQNFIYHLPKLQLKDVHEIIEKFEGLGQIINQKVNQFTPRQFMHIASINTLLNLLRETKDAFQEVMNNSKYQDLAIDSDQLDIQTQFHKIINKINCLFYLVQNKLFIPFIPAVMASGKTGIEASELIQSIQNYSPFAQIISQYLRMVIDLNIFDENSSAYQLMNIIFMFKRKTFKISFRRGKSAAANVIYIVFDETGSKCNYISVKANNENIFKQQSALNEFPILFLVNILTTIYNHLFIDQSIQIPLHLDEKSFPVSDTSIPLVLDNLWLGEENNKDYSNINKICGCLYGDNDYPQFFFTGVMKLFFNLSFNSLYSNDYESFVNWIVWLNKFFILFGNSKSFSYEKEQFINDINQFLSEAKSEEMINNVQNSIFSFPYDNIQSEDIDYIIDSLKDSIFNLSNDLEDANLSKMKDQKKREIERNFISIKRDIASKISTNRDKVLPFQLLLNSIKDIEHTEENFNIVKNIVNSINNVEEESTKKKFGFRWPNQNEAPSKSQPDEFFILKTLIDYSDEINRIQDIQDKPTWSKLCQMQVPNSVLIDFLKTEKVSKTTIGLLSKKARVKFIIKLMADEVKSYLDPNSIRIFVNDLYNRFKPINDGWVQIVQDFADKYPPEYQIYLPKFESTDLIALLVDPFNANPGPLLSNEIEYNDLLNDFFNLYNTTFKNFDHSLVSIQNNFQSMSIKFIHLEKGMKTQQLEKMRFNEFYSFISKLPEIPAEINELGSCISKITDIKEYISHKPNVSLIFDDISYLNKDDYIDKNPVSYFYLSLFPTVREYLKPIENFSDSNRFPLALIGFRVMSRSNCIQIQLPTNFQTEQISKIVSEKICNFLSNLNTQTSGRNKSQITNFHNAIGLLIENPPRNIVTNYTGHFRSSLIAVMSSIKDQTMFNMVQEQICKLLPGAIEIMLSPKWEEMIKEKYDQNNDILVFMRNPWSLLLKKISEDFDKEKTEVVEHINMLNSYIIKATKEQISENINEIYKKSKEDEDNFVKEKSIELLKFEQYFQEHEEDESLRDMRNYWKTYNIHLLNALDKLHYYTEKFQQVPSDDLYVNLLKHFKSANVSFPTSNVIPVLVIKAKDKKDRNISITITNNKTNNKVIIKGNLSKGISLLKLKDPKDTIVYDKKQFEIKENQNTEHEIIDIKYDPQFQPIKTFKYQIMEKSYNDFQSIYTRIQEQTSTQSLANFKVSKDDVVCNDDQEIQDYLDALNKIREDWPSMFKEDLSLNSYQSIFDRMNSDITKIRTYFPPKFRNGGIRQPTNTQSLMKKLMDCMNMVESQINSAKEELTSELLEKDSVITNNKSEYNQIQENIKNYQIFPSIEKPTSKVDLKSINEKDKMTNDLLAPSITSSDDPHKPFININEIVLDVGPLMSGIHTTPLRFRMVNFVSKKFDCIPEQKDEDLPIPVIESNTGYFIISIAVEELNASLTQDTDILFDGIFHFRFEGENKDFAAIPYKIKLHFTPPTFLLEIADHLFAIKNGDARIVDFYCPEGTVIKLTSLNKSLKFGLQIVEQIDNTAPRPYIYSSFVSSEITIPKKKPNEDLFSSCINLIFSSKLSASIHFRTKIEDASLCFAVFSDTHKDFVTEDAVINFGIFERTAYFIVGWMNQTNSKVTPTISVTSLNENKVKLKFKLPGKAFNTKKFDIYIYPFTVLPSLSKITKEDKLTGMISLELTKNLKRKLHFQLHFQPVSVYKNNYDGKMNIKYDQNYHASAFYGRSFIDLTKKEDVDKILNAQYQLIVSPFSYAFFSPNGEHCRINYRWDGCFINILTNGLEIHDLFDVLVINESGYVYIDEKTTLKNDNSNVVKLFAILKTNRSCVFPLFGKNTKEANREKDKEIYLELTPGRHNLTPFIRFFASFLYYQEIKERNLYNCGNLYNAFQTLTQRDNFGYFIDFFGQTFEQYDYLNIANKISQLIGNNYFYQAMQTETYKYSKDKQWEFMSFVKIVYDYIRSFSQYVSNQNGYITLPIKYEDIKERQVYELKAANLDLESIKKNSTLYKSLSKRIEGEKENEKHISDRMKTEGYKISSVVKWNPNEGFTAVTKEEIAKLNKSNAEVSHNYGKSIKINTSSAYLSNSLSIDMQMLNNNASLLTTFKTFDSYLKATYQFPFSLYSSIQKGNPVALKEPSNILSKLISIYLWATNNKITNYTVFKDFINDFTPAFISLILRLEKSNIHTGLPLSDSDKKSGEIDFLINPRQETITTSRLIWQQIGLSNDKIPNLNIASKQSSTLINLNDENSSDDEENGQKRSDNNDEEEEEEDKNNNDHPDKSKPTRKRAGRQRRKFNNQVKNNDLQDLESLRLKINKNGKERGTGFGIEYDTEDIKEMSNQELINTLIEQMISEQEEELEFQEIDLTHGESKNYSNKNNKTPRIGEFFTAAEFLTKQMISSVVSNESVLNNADDVYASILIECTTSMDHRQKATLILLSIAYANALTALKIPYALMIFGDPKFHFIMKKLDEKHEEIHFQRLLDMITIIRRFTSMHEAIKAARENIKHQARKNHAIFVLSDGLSRTLHLTNDWQELCLNDEKVSVSFFFLNIIESLTYENNDAESIIENVKQIWNHFSFEISNKEKTKSPSSVYYDEGQNVFTDPTKLINQFELALSSFPMTKTVSPVPSLMWYSINNVSDSIVTDGLEPVLIEIPQETKFYYNINENLEMNESADFEPPITPNESFTINLTNSEEYHKGFLRKLALISPQIYNSSSVQNLKSYLFVPNKPSQYSPSVNGTIFYFPGLVKFLLTHGQDTKIFLEKNAGLIMSYSIFIVIDCTTSCFSPTTNMTTFAHSVQSIVSLLTTLSHIDLPSITIIVTTKDGPAMLCCDVSTLTALSATSSVWIALFDRFMNPHDSDHIVSAMSSVLTLRMQQKTASACCFVFSDGCYSKRTRETVAALTNSIEIYKTTTITIAIGNLPNNASKLTRRTVWAPDPKHLLNGVNYLLGKESTSFIPEMYDFFTDEPMTNELFRETASLVDRPDEIVFDKLHDELNKVIRPFEMFQNYYNAEQKGIGEAVINPEGEIFDLGKNRKFNNQKVLFCMFWDSSMDAKESSDISVEVLKNGLPEKDKFGNFTSTVSAVKALTEFGMKVEIVQDYESAMKKMMSGKYSQIHIICGRGDEKLPNNGNPNLVGQFIECTIKYWQNGGGLVWWADNAPLCYELNLFLEMAEFPGDVKKTSLRIIGNHYGDGTLKPSSLKDLNKSAKCRCVFDENRRIEVEGTERPLFNFNLVSMYEGITVSYAQSPEESQMAPFKPFAVSSDGGVSIMYYASSNLNSKEGDIVIDCGFSKLFRELSKEGIWRYIRNIAVWMLSLEKHELNGRSTSEALNFHPEPFEYKIKPFVKWDRFINYKAKNAIYICFLIDGTGSMRFFIESVSKMCKSIAHYCNSKGKQNMFYYGAVIYRDPAYTRLFTPEKVDYNEFFPFTKNIEGLERFLNNIRTGGGGNDGPEDWLSGYSDMLKMNWKEGSKIVIHIADAPGHGTMFSGKQSDMDNEHDEKFPIVVKEAAERGFLFHCICGDQRAINCFRKTKAIYEKAGGKYFKIEEMGGDNQEKLQQTIIRIVKTSVDAAIAIPVKRP